MIRLEHGLVLVTGPRGSGKSTTLYAVLQEINAKDFTAVTLEDPIAYQLHGISQSQINLKKGMTFATGLRNVCGETPTSSCSARFATRRRPSWPSNRRSPDTWSLDASHEQCVERCHAYA
jgi:ABC-type multidrug transport system ATPase subunit